MAWRNIWRNKMRSMVIILSIAVGLFAGIAVLALYKGMMKSRVRTLIYAEAGHLQIHDSNFKKDYDPRYVIINGSKIIKEIASAPGVLLAAPRSITQGMLATTTGSAGVQINGVIPELEYAVSQLKRKIVEGAKFNSAKKNEVLIGKKLADKMKLKLRSKLVLTFTDSSGTIVSGAFRVAGIFQSDNAPLDEKNVYVDIKDLNALLSISYAFHEIVILLDRDEDVSSIQDNLRRRYPGLLIESWREISPETDLLVKTTNQYSYIIMIIIMIALAFGIINTMLMAIIERTREIGMMLALGINRLRLFTLILLETIFLTLAGTPIGILAAWLIINYYNKKGLNLSGLGEEMMSSFGFGMIIYPEFPIDKLAGVLIIVIATAIISCLFPALRALMLQPVVALRR
ncbi:ABC transporter permease [Daejeonella oryzae]|uniref:ABC transporter permease n=1 Tax=Daejeonella oryzae TaxID=1122943 RepID=UPI001C6600B7|nr:FtsX-like permease family protein [Daejeonella oryzae]